MKRLKDLRVITALWQEAFGDTEEEIAFFVNHARHAECVALASGNETAAMLFLVSCHLDGRKGKYIYAACTAKKHRGKGVMSALLSACMRSEPLLCLIPGDDGLVKYYFDRGFTAQTAIEGLSFDEEDEIVGYLLDGYHLTNPAVQYSMR